MANVASLANLRPWPKGVSGNPAGRPAGSRNKLEERFLADLLKDWEVNGAAAIEAGRIKDPMGYVKTVASLMPAKVDPDSGLNGVDREQLRTAIAALESFIAAGGAEEAPADAGQPESA